MSRSSPQTAAPPRTFRQVCLPPSGWCYAALRSLAVRSLAESGRGSGSSPAACSADESKGVGCALQPRARRYGTQCPAPPCAIRLIPQCQAFPQLSRSPWLRA
eukprot:13467047-Alexandrium_andersonii.AAC.1